MADLYGRSLDIVPISNSQEKAAAKLPWGRSASLTCGMGPMPPTSTGTASMKATMFAATALLSPRPTVPSTASSPTTTATSPPSSSSVVILTLEGFAQSGATQRRRLPRVQHATRAPTADRSEIEFLQERVPPDWRGDAVPLSSLKPCRNVSLK
jgi:hypothetical protein